jgi:glycosyltransferase involved in cell wall biosynthesis
MRRPLAIFIASWHGPNVAGARRLLELAEEVPEVDFVVLGSVGGALAGDALPRNVTLTGTVSHGFKQALLSVADVALNPVTVGSGTNLKMLDYFASGIPVIATSFGARGLGVQPGEHYLHAEPGELGEALRALRELSSDQREALARQARTFVETEGSWDVISGALLTEIMRRERTGAEPAVIRQTA